MKKKEVIIFIIIIISLIILDYINLPSLLGLKTSNINWAFCMGTLNIIVVIALYTLTYKIIDERTIEREKNKREIFVLLIKECYQKCLEYVNYLNQETVEKYIVPKVDFNSTSDKIINNLQNSPFSNENITMDLVKDGQAPKGQIEGYFKIKMKYEQYINMRIILFDGAHIYEPLKTDLCNAINDETKKLDNKT